MKRSTPFALAAALCAFAVPADAAPYCADLMSKDTLPSKYAKRGPFYSDKADGWIVGQDQLKSNFEVSTEVDMLWREIKDTFAEHGIALSVLAAPPRPMFASEQVLSQAGYSSDKIATEIAQPFSTYIAALNEAGLTAPDLSKLAQGPMDSPFYFQRDTHWTPFGAAQAVAHLSVAMQGGEVPDALDGLTFDQSYSEKGSLSAVVEKTCGTRPAAEDVVATNYAKSGAAADLLGDAGAADVALVGTSFSDRYKRDAYQVADALAFALDTQVDNFALTGGGLVGAMLSFIESGALVSGQYTRVVWESPYTAPLTNVHGLRQVLGALKAAGRPDVQALGEVQVSDDWVTLKGKFPYAAASGLQIRLPGATTGKLYVELVTASGDKTKIKLIKSDRIPAEDRTESWTLSLAGLADIEVDRIKLRLVGEDQKHSAQVLLMN